MFKSEYQGGPSVEVISGQGRDPLSKKCRVTGNASSIQKQYDKDVKSYVYILEGEPTTTKIQLPKDDKQTLFLLQKFLVLQLYVPVGRPFSFELGVSVTDQAQNKRRIFFSSSQKDVTVTSLHAKYPLNVLCLGTWLNLCLDLDSLVGETFNGQTFRALESITVTANCRLRRIFTLKAPPMDTSRDDVIPYPKTEPLPKNLQFTTTSDKRAITQVLSYQTLAQKPLEDLSNCPSARSTTGDASTPRQEVETHIAFGQKVVIPNHIRKTSVKDCQENTPGKTARSARLGHARTKLDNSASDVHIGRDDTVKGRGKQQQQGALLRNDDKEKPVDCTSAVMQPRPPKASSAGKVRRAVRVKQNNGSARGPSEERKQHESNNDDISRSTTSSKEIIKTDTAIRKSISVEGNPKNIDIEKVLRSVGITNSAACESVSQEKEDMMNSYNDCIRRTSDTNCKKTTPADSEVMAVPPRPSSVVYSDDPVQDENEALSSAEPDVDLNNNDHNKFLDDERNTSKSNGGTRFWNTKSTSNTNEVPFDNKEIANNNNDSKRKMSSNGELSREKNTNYNYSANEVTKLRSSKEGVPYEEITTKNSEEPCINSGVQHEQITKTNGNKTLLDNDRTSIDSTKSLDDEKSKNNETRCENAKNRPRKLTLPDNAVFTFASAPRSPRSSKKKFFPSPATEVPSVQPVEGVPEVKVSLTPEVLDVDKSDIQRSRGALLEDDFCKLSDDEFPENEDGIQKLLNSSLSPRHSPQPDHQLRQSIRSSLLKEIPSPLNGYDAQHYESEPHLAELNQSTASSWRFDISDGGDSLNNSRNDLEDSLNVSNGQLIDALTGDCLMSDDNEDDRHSDASDDTTYSTWRPPPPQEMRGNKYEHEMKPPGNEPDLTATICIDSSDYGNVFIPPKVPGGSKPVGSGHHPHSSGGGLVKKWGNEDDEEELDLLYDPCLNCYFDPVTHKYYELA